MPAVVIIVVSVLATAFLFALGLAIERWEWQRTIKLPHPAEPDRGKSIQGKVLSVIMVLLALGAIGMLSYTVTNPKGDKFTEFYLLGMNGKATEYPKELGVGETGKVTVGIVNHEYEPVTYHIEIAIDGVQNNELGPVALEHGEKWEGTTGFTPRRAGNNQKVEFLLYRQGQSDVYQTLYLWVNAR